MKNLLFLFLSLLAIGSLFQACDNSKTYAEMLEDEKNAVNQFIKDSAIHVISEDQFKANGYKTAVKGVDGATYDEYVSFSSNGVYMQVVKKGNLADPAVNTNVLDSFVNNNNICTRYMETNIATRELTCFNVFLPEYADASQLYERPAVFRYVKEELATTSYGVFLDDGMDYLWASQYGTTAVPGGWLLALPYIGNESHVRLIVPSKMGHSSAQQYVTPYFYDIWTFSKAKS